MTESAFFINLNLLIDLFFLADIIVNLNTAINDELTHVIIDNRCKIFISYIKSWLVIDILSILPFETILEWFTTNQDHDAQEGSAVNVN